MEGISYVQLQKECSTQISQAWYSLYSVQPILQFTKELNGRKIGATPGFNALPYIPFKKCKSLQDYIVKFARKVLASEICPCWLGLIIYCAASKIW